MGPYHHLRKIFYLLEIVMVSYKSVFKIKTPNQLQVANVLLSKKYSEKLFLKFVLEFLSTEKCDILFVHSSGQLGNFVYFQVKKSFLSPLCIYLEKLTII